MKREFKKPEVPDVPDWDASDDKFCGGVMTSHEDDEELPYAGTEKAAVEVQRKRSIKNKGESDGEER